MLRSQPWKRIISPQAGCPKSPRIALRVWTLPSLYAPSGLRSGLKCPGADEVYLPCSVIVLLGDTWHFHWARSGEYVIQVTAIGSNRSKIEDPGYL